MTDATPQVLRPTTAEYARWVRRPDPATVLLVAVLVGVPVLTGLGRWLVTGEIGGLVLLLGLIVIGVVIGLGGALLSMRTTSVTLTDTAIEHRSWFVRRTVLPRAGLRGLLCDYRPPVSQRASALLVLQAADGRGRRIRLNGAFWDLADLVTIAQAAGVPHEDRELRARAVESRLPGVLRFPERRPVTFLVLFPCAVLVMAFAAGAVLLAVGGDKSDEFPATVAAAQNDLVDEVATAVDASWRGRAFVTVGECDTPADGAVRIVERRTEVAVSGDALAGVASAVEAVARDAGLSDVDTDVTEAGFEVTADDGDSSFQGGSTLDVELDEGTLSLTHSTRCVGDS